VPSKGQADETASARVERGPGRRFLSHVDGRRVFAGLAGLALQRRCAPRARVICAPSDGAVAVTAPRAVQWVRKSSGIHQGHPAAAHAPLTSVVCFLSLLFSFLSLSGGLRLPTLRAPSVRQSARQAGTRGTGPDSGTLTNHSTQEHTTHTRTHAHTKGHGAQRNAPTSTHTERQTLRPRPSFLSSLAALAEAPPADTGALTQ
jgi:hypothetical protein